MTVRATENSSERSIEVRNERTSELTNQRTKELTNDRTNDCPTGRLTDQPTEQTNERTKQRTDIRTDERTNVRPTDRPTDIPTTCYEIALHGFRPVQYRSAPVSIVINVMRSTPVPATPRSCNNLYCVLTMSDCVQLSNRGAENQLRLG